MRSEIEELHLENREYFLGATVGEHVFEGFLAGRADGTGPLLLRLAGVRQLNASFLKATWLLFRERSSRPLYFADLAGDVRDDIHGFLSLYRTASLELISWEGCEISRARVLGRLEHSSMAALDALLEHPACTAPELRELSDNSISPTAWTNRLNELHRLGLATREKDGRAWRFSPVMEVRQDG